MSSVPPNSCNTSLATDDGSSDSETVERFQNLTSNCLSSTGKSDATPSTDAVNHLIPSPPKASITTTAVTDKPTTPTKPEGGLIPPLVKSDDPPPSGRTSLALRNAK